MKEYYKKVEMRDWMNEVFFDDWTIQNNNGMSPEKVKGRKAFKVAFLSFMMRLNIFSVNMQKNKLGFSVSSNTIRFWFGGRMSNITVIRYCKFFEELEILKVVAKYSFKNSQHLSNIYNLDMNKAYKWLEEYAGVREVDLDYSRMFEFFENAKKYNKQNKIKEELESMTEEEQAEFFENEAKKEKNRQKKEEKIKQDNEEFLNILDTVNTYGVEMRYLNEESHRLTNPICNTRNERHEDSTRIEDIKKLFNTNKEIVEYDINASIYRLSYLLGQQKLCSHEVDIYEEVFKLCKFKYNGSWEEIRNDFKKLFMPIYMRASSIKWTSDNYEFMKNWTYFIDCKKKEQVDFYKKILKKLNIDNLYELLSTIRDSMKSYLNLNKFYQAKIFIHESNLHILMLKEFQDRGYKVINVYDGFYFEKGMTQEIFNDVYDKCSIELLNMMNRPKPKKKRGGKKKC